MDLNYKIYSSIDQMAPSVQEGLAQLLCREVPNLQWLKEKDAFPHQETSYYVFFEGDQGHPVGILRPVARRLAVAPQKSLFKRLLNPKSPQKWLNIQSPGASGHGFIFDSHYQQLAIPQVLEVIAGQIRSGYDLIQLSVPPHLSFDFPYRARTSEWRQYNILPKVQESYQDYLSHLNGQLKQKIQLEEQFFNSQTQYELVGATSLSELFQKNSSRITTYQQIKGHLFLSCYQNTPARFWALYCEDRLLSIAVFVPGCQNQAFADIICNLDLEMNSSFHHLLLQKLIKEFYRWEELEELRFFNTLNCPRDLQNDLPAMQLQASHGKTYIIPSKARHKRRGRWRKSRQSSRAKLMAMGR